MDKITAVAQKGFFFSSTKYCQEVLIGVVDSINHINFRKKHGALLSLDIKKAFDSTSHSYLQQVYKFFNFGPNFIRWLNLVATNRRACIILENEVYSEFFDLERGNAQGDTTSPYIFNIGFQILLFKLTFDLQIEGLIDFPELLDGIPPPFCQRQVPTTEKLALMPMTLICWLNFVSSVATVNNRCLNIVRLENASLLELVEFAKEVLCTVRIPEGSVLLFGSGSQLGRCGTTIYAIEWVSVVAQVTSLWHGVHVCPLILLVVTACPGTLTREIVKFTIWLDHVYEGDTKGLRQSWVWVAEAMENISVGSAAMDAMDTYKLALPPTLIPGAPLASITFCSTGSRPNAFPVLSKDNCSELLRLLIATIYTNFRACESPEIFLVRTENAQNKTTVSENREQKVMLVGASKLRYSSVYFTRDKFEFVDQSEPGWSASVNNIGKLLLQTQKNVQDGATAFVFDILGNTSVRFEQFDGSTALPYKSDGRFHLGRKIVISSPEPFSKTIDAIMPILRATKDKPCVIIPPLPRYLFARCCDDAGHCTNFDQSDFAQNLLSGYIQLRNLLIRSLVQKGLKNFKVLDTCCVTTCKTTANINERIAEMKKVTLKDGVHFVAAGYGNLATRAISSLVAVLVAPRRELKTTTHFWRGFKSDKLKVSASGTVRGRGQGNLRGRRLARGFHPYYRK
jgi:hypothetical protein